MPQKTSFDAAYYIKNVLPIVKRDGNRLIGPDFTFQPDGTKPNTSGTTIETIESMGFLATQSLLIIYGIPVSFDEIICFFFIIEMFPSTFRHRRPETAMSPSKPSQIDHDRLKTFQTMKIINFFVEDFFIDKFVMLLLKALILVLLQISMIFFHHEI